MVDRCKGVLKTTAWGKRIAGIPSYMLLFSTEMHVELMQMLRQGAFGYFGEGVNILGEALAAVATLAIGTGHIGVRVVDVAREEHHSTSEQRYHIKYLFITTLFIY